MIALRGPQQARVFVQRRIRRMELSTLLWVHAHAPALA
jgi:hypothetical protein